MNFDLQGNLSVYFIFAGLAFFIGIVAGIYPAFRLSKFQPLKVLRNFNSLGPGKLGLQKVLSISQFVISLLFITTSILIYNQFRHFLEFEYGFNTKNIINIELQGNDYQLVSNELSSVSGVTTSSASNYIPATNVQNGIFLKNVSGKEDYKKLTILLTDENFIDNLGIKLLAGRHLETVSDSSDQFILVNEGAVKEFGYQYPSEIIGQVFESQHTKKSLEVIGVVKDFVFKAPFGGTDKIGPLVLKNEPQNFNYMNMQIASSDVTGTIARLESKWKMVDPVHPFKYEFFEQQLAATNQVLFDVVTIIGYIAFLSVSIACLGLLGIAIYTSERRTKEVGIRKVLGAKIFGIAFFLSRGFLKILAISILIAAPLSYFLNSLWLQNLPNRVDFGFDTVLLGSLILLVLGFITIGSQTIRAAKRNPIDSLRID